MKGLYFAFPSLPEEWYVSPTPEAMFWAAAFVIMFGLVIAFCWWRGK